MGLTPDQRSQIIDIAKIEAREYFDHYQEHVFPRQLKAYIKTHDDSEIAHGGVEKKVSRMIWIGTGLLLASGGIHVLVTKAMAAYTG